MDKEYKLVHFSLDPFSRRIRLALNEYGVSYALMEEYPWKKREELLQLNPSGQVPVLILPSGEAICGHEAITPFIDENIGVTQPLSLMPKDLFARAEIRRLTAWFDDKFRKEVSDNIIHEKLNKRLMHVAEGGGPPNMDKIRLGMQNLKNHLDYIGHVVEQRNWMAGEDLSHADLAAGAQLSVLDYLGDVPWDHNIMAKDWYARLKSRPSFRGLLKDHLSTIEPSSSYADLDF